MDELKKKYLLLANLLTSSSNQKLIIFLLIGIVLIGFGVLAYKIDLFTTGDKVEVLNGTMSGQGSDSVMVVEISGSVEKPGVYKMKFGDRIDDLLIISGGLSVDADRDWVTKYINRAAKLSDGQKIYIYHLNEVSANKIDTTKTTRDVLGTISQDPSNFININTSSQSELEKLVGIGPVYARKIIEQRPYSILEELVSKGVIGQKVFNKIKNNISI